MPTKTMDDVLGELPVGEHKESAQAQETTAERDRLMRALADAENTRRIAERRVQDARQYAIADFLASGGYDHHLRRLRRELAHNIERARRVVQREFPDGTRVSNPQGGFVLWLELPTGLDTRQILTVALEQGICFAPGEAFSATGRFRHHMRISCGSDWQVLEPALVHLGRLVCTYAPPTAQQSL